MVNKIYTITGMVHPSNHHGPDRHCFGFYCDLDKAIETIEKDNGSFCECCYSYLLIEEVEEGICTFDRQEWWYVWDLHKNKWIKTDDRPKGLFGIINFSIG